MSRANTYKSQEYLYESPIRPKIGSMSILADNLRRLRKEAGLTQDQMADRLGILRTNYVPYENKGGPPSDETLQKIAEIVGARYEDLVTWKEADEIGKKDRAAIELAYQQYVQKLGSDKAMEILEAKRAERKAKRDKQ